MLCAALAASSIAFAAAAQGGSAPAPQAGAPAQPSPDMSQAPAPAAGSPLTLERAIQLGVSKFNVNTELREAYLGALRRELEQARPPDLLDLLRAVVSDMQAVVAGKLQLFGSAGRAQTA